LKTEYKEGQMTLDEAKKLAVKILSKTLDATKLTADKGIIYWKCTNIYKFLTVKKTSVFTIFRVCRNTSAENLFNLLFYFYII